MESEPHVTVVGLQLQVRSIFSHSSGMQEKGLPHRCLKEEEKRNRLVEVTVVVCRRKSNDLVFVVAE
jgi:hypothetical protein